ncbi:MAG TPA: polysaccharide biosynthesis tyrosine autokinase [Croceibacterium sp.]|nr:polysaccharide biosynthesis tyrosine autokinase [Croceibacterium sp.]
MNDLTFSRPVDAAGLQPDHPGAADERGRAGEQPILLRYLNIIKRQKWVLIGAVVVAAIAGLVITLLMTPQYTAEVTLEVQRENVRIVNMQGVEPESGTVDLEFYETQWGLLRSQTLAERVAAELRLHEDPKFFEMFGMTEEAEQLADRRSGGARAGRQERIRDAATVLLRQVNISPQRMSRLVDIQFTSPDPQLSTRVANEWAKGFVEISLERKFEATSYARNFLEERLEQLRGRLQDSERQLVAYAANQRIINVPTATTTGTLEAGTTERPLVAEALSSLNVELSEATAARMTAQGRLRSAGGDTLEALSNQAISELRARRATLAAEHAKLMAQFEPGYPPARAMADQIAELDRAIVREEGRVRTTLQSAYNAAAARENLLRQEVESMEGELLNLRGRTIQYNIFQREVDTNRQLYDALLQRYKEIGVAGGVGMNNISIVDPAQVPERPSSPNLIINLLIAMMVGGVIGAGLALALEQVDETISNPREVETALGMPLLGTIPTTEQDEPTTELEDPKSHLVEAYLSALTRLAFTTDHGVPKTLAVTSSRPGEGKTTTAFAIARQLARTSKRVVLIDGDMRSPSLHQILGVPNTRGLSNYLAGDDDLTEMLHARTQGITLLPSGPTPPNAAELLTGERISRLLRELTNRFDHVLIDAPPVMGLADTPIFGSVTEGVVFVIESHQTPTTMARVALERLRQSNAKLLGALLTKFETQKSDYGYAYEYGYGYGATQGEPERV